MELKKGYCNTCRHMSEEETMKREYAFLMRVGFSYCALVDGWKSDIDSRPCKCWEPKLTEEEDDLMKVRIKETNRLFIENKMSRRGRRVKGRKK